MIFIRYIFALKYKRSGCTQPLRLSICRFLNYFCLLVYLLFNNRVISGVML